MAADSNPKLNLDIVTRNDVKKRSIHDGNKGLLELYDVYNIVQTIATPTTSWLNRGNIFQ